jgi:hypothetical protein
MSSTILQTRQPLLEEIPSRDIELLNRYFSTKTLYDVKLACDEEAKQILQASLTDPPIRHAVLSLKALREDLEAFGDIPTSVEQQTPHYDNGLQQYCIALGGLASQLSSPDSNVLRSVLLCCQIFISIEQVRGDYVVMAKHIIQGLGIMRENRARPHVDAANKLVPARLEQLPFLDVFIIKMFAAPCKFTDHQGATDTSATTVPVRGTSSNEQAVKSRDLRTIAPNMRTELTRIATSTIEFLSKVSNLKATRDIRQLFCEKAFLLYSLDSWLSNLEHMHAEATSFRPELISVSFMRLFYHILRIVLLGTLSALPNLHVVLQADTNRLQSLACSLGESVKGYRICDVTKNKRREHTKVL